MAAGATAGRRGLAQPARPRPSAVAAARRRLADGREPGAARRRRRRSRSSPASTSTGSSPASLHALHAASLTRRTTVALLAAMLPAEDAGAAFQRLRGLPFVELGRDGLVVHDTVREATAALLRATDPARADGYRAGGVARAARRGARAPAATPGARWPTCCTSSTTRWCATSSSRLGRRPRRRARPAGRLAGDPGPRRAPTARRRRAWRRGGARCRARSPSRATGTARSAPSAARPSSVTSPSRWPRSTRCSRRWRGHLRRDPVPRGAARRLRPLPDRARRLPLGPRAARRPSPGRAALLLDTKAAGIELLGETAPRVRRRRPPWRAPTGCAR